MTLPPSHTLRPATPADAETIQSQRDAMFTDMGHDAGRIAQARGASLAWLGTALADGTYTGVLAEQGGGVSGGAGVLWQQFPPSPRSLNVVRAYVLNVYVRPEHRGQGLAGRLVAHLLTECRQRGVEYVSLHASEAGRAVYARLGFEPSDQEMRLTLPHEVPA